MTGPHDPLATDGDRLRAARADRERVIEALKDAFVHGRLTRDEFGVRAARALAARTLADLAVLTADIPAARIAAEPAVAGPGRPSGAARRRPLAKAAAGSGGCLAFASGVLWIASHLDNPFGSSTYENWIPLCLVVAGVAMLMALFILGYGVGAALEQRRSVSHLPPRPGPDRRLPGAVRRGRASHGPDRPSPRATTSAPQSSAAAASARSSTCSPPPEPRPHPARMTTETSPATTWFERGLRALGEN